LFGPTITPNCVQSMRSVLMSAAGSMSSITLHRTSAEVEVSKKDFEGFLIRSAKHIATNPDQGSMMLP
jgi:hypothetical protein